MPIDTYEFETKKSPLETYEWDDIWWDHAPDAEGRRILIIGDSISRGYRHALGKLEGREIFVDGIATSKAADNESFYTLLDYYASTGLRYDAVLINNGLHGWHLEDSEEYRVHYEKLASYVKEKFAPEKFFIVLTTPVRKSGQTEIFDERNERAKVRNTVATAIAKDAGAKVIDLYSLLEDRTELYTQDGVHLIPDGYSLIAGKVLENI